MDGSEACLVLLPWCSFTCSTVLSLTLRGKILFVITCPTIRWLHALKLWGRGGKRRGKKANWSPSRIMKCVVGRGSCVMCIRWLVPWTRAVRSPESAQSIHQRYTTNAVNDGCKNSSSVITDHMERGLGQSIMRYVVHAIFNVFKENDQPPGRRENAQLLSTSLWMTTARHGRRYDQKRLPY